MDESNNNNASSSKVSRRKLLVTVGTGAGVAAIAACGPTGGGTDDAGTTMLDAGAVTDFAVGTCLAPAHSHTIVCRDSAGFYAFTSICTHEACDVPKPTNTDATTTTMCPCHRSIYNANGDVVMGAISGQANLNHYAVTITGGRVMVDKSMILTDRTTRTPVPVDTDAGDTG